MSSIRSQIMAAINSRLNALGAPCTFYRSRMSEFQSSELTPNGAGNFFPVEEPSKLDGKENESNLTLAVAAIVLISQDPVDEALDPILIWAEQQIMADDKLGGLCVSIQKTGTKWVMAEKGAEQCAGVMRFDINYRTALTDTTADES